MSVWSRSHSDLAKIAKELEERNNRARHYLKRQNGNSLSRARSLSPGALSSGEVQKSGTPHKMLSKAQDGKELSPVGLQSGQSPLSDHSLSLGGVALAAEVNAKPLNPAPNMASVSIDENDPEYEYLLKFSSDDKMSTSAGSLSNASTRSDMCMEIPYSASTCSDEYSQKYANTPDDSRLSNSMDCFSNLSQSGGETMGSQTSGATDKFHGGAITDFFSEEEKNDTPLKDSELLAEQNASIISGPSSPRLSKRSPELFRKLHEMSFSLSAGKFRSPRKERDMRLLLSTCKPQSSLQTREIDLHLSSSKLQSTSQKCESSFSKSTEEFQSLRRECEMNSHLSSSKPQSPRKDYEMRFSESSGEPYSISQECEINSSQRSCKPQSQTKGCEMNFSKSSGEPHSVLQECEINCLSSSKTESLKKECEMSFSESAEVQSSRGESTIENMLSDEIRDTSVDVDTQSFEIFNISGGLIIKSECILEKSNQDILSKPGCSVEMPVKGCHPFHGNLPVQPACASQRNQEILDLVKDKKALLPHLSTPYLPNEVSECSNLHFTRALDSSAGISLSSSLNSTEAIFSPCSKISIETSSQLQPKPTSHLQIQNIDLKLVPLSAISIAVGASENTNLHHSVDTSIQPTLHTNKSLNAEELKQACPNPSSSQQMKPNSLPALSSGFSVSSNCSTCNSLGEEKCEISSDANQLECSRCSSQNTSHTESEVKLRRLWAETELPISGSRQESKETVLSLASNASSCSAEDKSLESSTSGIEVDNGDSPGLSELPAALSDISECLQEQRHVHEYPFFPLKNSHHKFERELNKCCCSQSHIVSLSGENCTHSCDESIGSRSSNGDWRKTLKSELVILSAPAKSKKFLNGRPKHAASGSPTYGTCGRPKHEKSYSVSNPSNASELDESDPNTSEVGSHRSAVSAYEEASMAGTNDQSYGSSFDDRKRSHKKSRQTKERANKDRQMKDCALTKTSVRTTDRSNVVIGSDRTTDRSAEISLHRHSHHPKQSHRSFSISSVDSLFSVSDTSSCTTDVMNYLTSFSHSHRQKNQPINKKRLKKFIRLLQHPQQVDASTSSDAVRVSDFSKTVTDLHHLFISLSRHLEQQQQQPQEQVQQLPEQRLRHSPSLQGQELQKQFQESRKQTEPTSACFKAHGRLSAQQEDIHLNFLSPDETDAWDPNQAILIDPDFGQLHPKKRESKEAVLVTDRSPRQDTLEKRQSERGGEVPSGAGIKMDMAEETHLRLDEEFDKLLVDMKPHVLKLPKKADRQKCAVWIKKLCEPPSSGITGRKNRNMYAQLMLHMLKRGSIQGPFDKKPEEGPLPTLPSYMAIYFDEPLDKANGEVEKLPDWVEGELAETVGSTLFRISDRLGNPAATSTWMSHAGSSLRDTQHRPHTSMGIGLDKDPGLSPIKSDYHYKDRYSVDDLSVDIKHPSVRIISPTGGEHRHLPDVNRLTASPESKIQENTDGIDWSRSLGISASTSLGQGPLFQDETSLTKPSDKEVALRTKMIEARFHEEKLKLQQRHDAAVQKILDRKNSEIEDVKGHYRNKTKELEDVIHKLEKKVQTLVKEAAIVRETKDKQISELKKMIEDTGETRRNEFEKKLNDMETDFEQQKFDLQKLHTRNIQEILDDTNTRLQRMEAEYNQQAVNTTSVIKELESRVQQLTSEVDRTLSQRSVLEKEKAELQGKMEKLLLELQASRERASHMEREHQKRLEVAEHEMRSIRNKTEASLEFIKQEHNIAASKAADSISDLEQQIEYLKKALKDTEEHRQRQMRETEQVHQQDKLHLENLHDKQVRSMKKELEQMEQEMQRKVSRLEQLLQDKETELQKQKEHAKEQAHQADKALEDFKLQVEKSQNQIYSEMKQQMDQVQADLRKSKQVRERQSQEFARQLGEEKYKHEHEMTELKLNLENEKGQLLHELHLQKEHMTSERDQEIELLRDVQKKELKAIEHRFKERQEKDNKMLGELEAQVGQLREELVQANQLRKQQLVELGLLREEEKQKMQRDHEAELARFRTEAEQQRLELQKLHSTETERLLEKTNERLKSIEREYAERGKKSAEGVGELQATVKQLRDEIKRVKENADSKISDMRNQFEEEKQGIKKQYSSNVGMLQHELESQRTRYHKLERQLQKMDQDHEEKITRIKLGQEDKLRGMFPIEMKQELEDTILSLKSQVNSLQQRAAMLQEELDLRLKNPLGSFGSRTSSPIKSSVHG